MNKFQEKIKELEFSLDDSHLPSTEELVREFELELPEDFKSFLLYSAGYEGSANCNFLEPTPMGKRTMIDNFYGFSKDGEHTISYNTNLIEGAPYVIAIGGDNMMGAMFWLKYLGKDKGWTKPQCGGLCSTQESNKLVIFAACRLTNLFIKNTINKNMYHNEDTKPLKIILAILVLFLAIFFSFLAFLNKDTKFFNDFLLPALGFFAVAFIQIVRAMKSAD